MLVTELNLWTNSNLTTQVLSVKRTLLARTALELVETSAYLVKSFFNYNKGDKEHRVICQDDSYRRVEIPARAGGAILATRSKVIIMQSTNV